ncbi:hypothetical protein SO802_018376 [Lithocarpus litseifolius]|uniref:Reverse transcriptase domain-containing protein n=1 Tax=Lithocarpus litseifolius TaxID=425828 RepID=A0AAW2CLU9_9ROSI
MLVLKAPRARWRKHWRSKIFRFESMWLKDERCEEVVSEAWERGKNMGTQNLFTQCMDECRRSLSSWNKNTFGHVGQKISTLQEKLQSLEGRRVGLVDMEEIEETRLELNRMMAVEEDMWHQRSRNCWLKSGDCNTSFFHAKASNRHQRNTILRIRDSEDNWQDDEGEISRIFVEYFENLFTSSQPVVSAELLGALYTKVTDGMNARLLREFQASEVEKALKQMHPMKAPGPDGMAPLFYQHFWPTVNSIVIQTVLDFLNHGAAPPKFHETHIVLIPKTKNPERVTNYRPISLCNVAYKLASKVVANRLKLVLQDIICENQSAFVSERLITDNVLVAHEIMNHINRKKKGKCGEMALKLDMSKAYDRVEWDCLKQIMAKLGFHEDWIRLVMRCVSSVTYAVRINGHACGQIIPTRGLRQGDPLSPYLFLICAEGLSALLHKAVQNKDLRGVAASTRGPRISHLFFANDSLIFGRATVKECTEIQRVLQVYEESSGQQLNRNKTSLFFSHNIANGVRETIKAMFGAQVIKPHESYLGLPSLVGRLQAVRVCDLIDETRKEWKEDLIRQCFLPQDVEAILSIPLSAHGGRDRMIWAATKNGKFTVQSAYKLA